MLSLSEKRWSELTHAYGSASDIPELILSLSNFTAYKDYTDEPYYSLWSALCHQGDVYTASYAAFPHLINFCVANRKKAHVSVIQLAVHIDMGRLSNATAPIIPPDLTDGYFKAKQNLHSVVSGMLANNPSNDLAVLTMQSTALVLDNGEWAQAIIEFTPNVASKFLKKF